MPALKGFEVQTHSLGKGREIDVLHHPDHSLFLWVPAQQVAEHSNWSRRRTGEHSTSDIGKDLDPMYRMRVEDPHKLYSRSRVKSTTLFNVEGLIQKTFHTRKQGYLEFCHDFIAQVLPAYEAFAAHYAELVLIWRDAIDGAVTGQYLREDSFTQALALCADRCAVRPAARPILILGTLTLDGVLSNWAKTTLDPIPVASAATVLTFPVAQLHAANKRAQAYWDQHSDGPAMTFHLALAYPDGAISLPDGTLVAGPSVAAASEPPPETEPAVDRPLPGLPAGFNGHPCPTYGSYEDPEWIGLYVCDALGIVDHHDALSRVPAEEKGRVIAPTQVSSRGRKTQSYVTIKEAGLYRLISESHKPEAEAFKNWLYREVLPAIRRYGYYAQPGAQPGPTAEELRAALRTIVREELAAAVGRIIPTQVGAAQVAALVEPLVAAAERLAESNVIHQQQLTLMGQTIELILPSKELFLPAKDYVEMDGVADALKRAPRLAAPALEMDHCPDYGKASLFMKRLCRAENKKVAANAVARIIARDAGQPLPPLYIPEFRMRKIEREHAKVLMFNPACWAFCKQTFLPADTPTLLFPGPRAEAAPGARDQAGEV